MKKEVLMLTLTLLAVAMLATPAMSVSPKKIPVTVSRSGSYVDFPPSSRVWTRGNVRHCRGFTGGWLTFDFMGDDVSIPGSVETYYGSYNVNLKNGRGYVHRRMVLTLDDGGIFEGEHIQNGIFSTGGMIPMPIDVHIHVVFRGTGDYQGWTIVRTGQTGEPWESYLLIP